MKNILLLSINARYTHSNLAILYMRDTLKDLNYNINILEQSINQDRFKILSDVVNHKPDILAISTYIWNGDYVKFLTENIKKLFPQIIIVLGGPEAGYNSEKWLNREYAPDYIVKGAGEDSLRYLAENEFNVPEKVISHYCSNFKNMAMPYDDDDIERLKTKYIYYEASRGCPFQCSFCISSRMDQKLEYKEIDLVLGELDIILQSKPRIVKFVDRSFNADREFARTVWKFINSLETTTKFHFEIHPALLEDVDFKILANTPKERIQFEIGIQSTNTDTLTAINRHYTFASLRDKVIKLLELNNIHSHLDLIAGLPYEDKNSYLNSVNDLLALGSDVIQLGFLKVLPGTEMSDKVEEYGIIFDSEAPYQILQNKWLSFKDMQFLHKFEDVFDIYYNSERMQATINHFITDFDRPVDLFIKLNDFIPEDIDFTELGWERRFKLIYDFLLANFDSTQHEVIKDFLAWDWLNHSKKNNIPVFIDRQANHEFKKAVFKDLKGDNKEWWNDFLGSYTKKLNNCAFFTPESNEFKAEVLNDNSKVLIFKDRVVLVSSDLN